MTAVATKPEDPVFSVEAEQRGSLEVQPAVLRKIAAHAADVDPGSARSGRKHAASAEVSGPDDALRVRLTVAVRYPDPVRDTVASMRERVSAELQRIAGCRVRSIDVTVSALVPPAEPPRVE
ncbi:Asp23/Gls24 family envelope stress response protein [Saccharopolyspora rhizosphaerae]|uniref:Asp23/Gls24 family envelope stress response protein n=1 Tax=Saccharopolyspora rhizosphaerae TaxID=2492662 RepID=A0A3R8Q169_9PSEU|nr:Asp23/Gls24 family envelope stress response protein [Saccharopolyspora rhizosphaerae]RRO14789.1 Asp23/Gls24 family envelope stress response protein [Saccharopolyspora rhizosphaerae]